MKSPVVSLFLLITVTVSAVIAPAQTPRRKVSESKPGQQSSGTLKICQGVPLPPGYTITGYMTTAACPHGAYVIRKQHPDDSPVAANRSEDAESDSSIAPRENQNTKSEKPRARHKKQRTAPQKSVAVNNGDPAPAGDAVAFSRPRRVGGTEPDSGPPVLQGAHTAQSDPPGPPTLRGATTSTGTPTDASTEVAVPEAGPEEVGEGDVVRVDTALVAVPVSVLDRQGRFVPNLQREDFSIFENGVEQSVAYFEPADKPFTVALILDTSASTHFHLWQIKEAAIAFAKQLRPQDRVLVVSFNDQVLLLTEATNDLNVVSAVITQNATTGDSTRLYDAVDLVIKERLNKIKGRKAIVLFTDGVDTSSYLATYQSTLREVEELDALIYPIQYDTTDYLRAMQNTGSVTVTTTSSNWPFSGRSTTRVVTSGPVMTTAGGAPLPGTTKADYEQANKYLHALADRTGARLYKADDPKQLAQAFSLIAEELRRQYSLGYYPQTPAVAGDERRQIKVRVRKPNLAVRARDSYVRSSAATPVQ